MSECLHCEINQLVQERMESGHADLAELASMMVESLADLVLLTPESEQPKLMAYALSAFGQMLLEKSGAVEGGSTATHYWFYPSLLVRSIRNIPRAPLELEGVRASDAGYLLSASLHLDRQGVRPERERHGCSFPWPCRAGQECGRDGPGSRRQDRRLRPWRTE
jgi:hypothetical protein